MHDSELDPFTLMNIIGTICKNQSLKIRWELCSRLHFLILMIASTMQEESVCWITESKFVFLAAWQANKSRDKVLGQRLTLGLESLQTQEDDGLEIGRASCRERV